MHRLFRALYLRSHATASPSTIPRQAVSEPRAALFIVLQSSASAFSCPIGTASMCPRLIAFQLHFLLVASLLCSAVPLRDSVGWASFRRPCSWPCGLRPKCPLQLRGGSDDTDSSTWGASSGNGEIRDRQDRRKPLPPSAFAWDPAIEQDPRWNRSVRIGFSGVVESIRVIPVRMPGCMSSKRLRAVQACTIVPSRVMLVCTTGRPWRDSGRPLSSSRRRCQRVVLV